MDLYSDFNSEHWDNKGSPPQNLADLDGYEIQNIMRVTKEDGPNGPVFTYYTSSDGGVPSHVELHGAKRDPLKGIGHCGMKIVVKNYVTLIVGCIVEQDWVEVKKEYFDALQVQGEPPKEVKPARLSMIFGLISDLNNEKWTKKENPPKNRSSLGYGYYTVGRETTEKGERKYFLNDDEGRPIEAYLEHAQRNPFRSIGNCYLKIEKVSDKNFMKGIMIDDDWVEAN